MEPSKFGCVAAHLLLDTELIDPLSAHSYACVEIQTATVNVACTADEETSYGTKENQGTQNLEAGGLQAPEPENEVDGLTKQNLGAGGPAEETKQTCSEDDNDKKVETWWESVGCMPVY